MHRDGEARVDGSAAMYVGEWLQSWATKTYAELTELGRHSDASIKRRHVTNHLAPRLADIRIGELKPSHLNALWRDLRASGLSDKSIMNIRATLSGAVKQLVADGVIHVNPVRDSSLPSRHRGEQRRTPPARRTLTLEELRKLIEWTARRLDTERWALPTLILAVTGLRRGEVFGLKWGDVHTESATIAIMRQVVQLDDGTLHVGPLKTSASERIITVPRIVVEALSAHRRRHENGSALVFSCGSAGRPMNPESYSQWFRKQLRPALGYGDWFTPHVLRHSHATQLLELGIARKDVQARLGHAAPSMTDQYSHGTTQADREAIQALTSAIKRTAQRG